MMSYENLSQLNNRKALAPTSVPVTIFKDSTDVLVRPLSFILNQSFEQGIFFEIQKVSPIHKKEDTLTVSNYRTISLLSVFRKIFKKAMHYRVCSFLCKCKLINTNHFAFRSNHLMEHALISYIETIKTFLDNDEVFIDFQKTFDTVKHEILLEKLNHYGI